MKHNFMTKMVSALLAVVLSTAAFSVTAFASGGEESTESVVEQETAGDVSDLLSALALRKHYYRYRYSAHTTLMF